MIQVQLQVVIMLDNQSAELLARLLGKLIEINLTKVESDSGGELNPALLALTSAVLVTDLPYEEARDLLVPIFRAVLMTLQLPMVFVREAVAARISIEQGVTLSANDMLMTCGAAGGLNVRD